MIFVFIGPTLAAEEARRHLDAVFLPPVSQGDVYRAGVHRPQAIGIVDGYFDQVPSVWHKEILWAMSQGVRVFGSASMGALRAAELAPFGMIGIGRVFEAFQQLELEDDDEVALRHGPPESGYRQMSEPMVNIRATMAAAHQARVIGSATRDVLLGVAKELYYPERNYRAILAMAGEQGCLAAELEDLASWLPLGRIDQKRDDAIAMLQAMRQTVANQAAFDAVFHFENTTLWDELHRSAGQLAVHLDADAEMLPQQFLLDELRLAGSGWSDAVMTALARQLAGRELRRQGYTVSEDRLCEAIVRFRRERGLLEGNDLEQWIMNNDLSERAFLHLIEKATALREMEELAGVEIASEIVDHARLKGDYPRLARRALAKGPIFTEIDAEPPTPETYELALDWFFRTRDQPRQTPTVEARLFGFDGVDEMRRAVLVEYLYCKRNATHGSNGTDNGWTVTPGGRARSNESHADTV